MIVIDPLFTSDQGAGDPLVPGCLPLLLRRKSAEHVMELPTEAWEQAVDALGEAFVWFEEYGYPRLLERAMWPDGMIEERRSISKRSRFRIFTRDEFTCQYCGERAPDVVLVVDHVIPVSRGGRTCLANLITSCEPCNQGKTNRTFDVEVACFYLKMIADKKRLARPEE